VSLFLRKLRLLKNWSRKFLTFNELELEQSHCHFAEQVPSSFPGFVKCLQCWECQADQTHLCSSCQVAAFCCTTCQRVAWRRGHKKVCPRFQRIREYAHVQCQKIAEVHKQGFIPGSLLKPNPYGDYILVSICVEREAGTMHVSEPLPAADQIPNQLGIFTKILSR
jgi:hypothetical protein